METNISSNQSQLQQAATGQEVEPKGIVLNRMYTGSYLSTNLGHEVINMFQADNGMHYLYLNAKGNFAKKHQQQISDMLLIRYAGNNKVEVLAWANGLTEFEGASESYIDFEHDCSIFNTQSKHITNEIKYGGFDLIKLFLGSAQQNVYITYTAENFYRPTKRIYIQYIIDENKLLYEGNVENYVENGEKDITIFLDGYQFGKATLKQYIYPSNHNNGQFKFDKRKKNDEYRKQYNASKLHSEEEFITNLEKTVNDKRANDWSKLSKLLDETYDSKTLWVKDEKKAATVEMNGLSNFQPKSKEVSLFDIMPKLQRDENCFSDALKYFINRDKTSWQGILEKLCNGDNIGLILSIEREKDASIFKTQKDDDQTHNGDNNDKKGGRIDLLIRTEKAYIVIENKIKSGINSKADDDKGNDQLDRYRNYVNYRIIGEYICRLEEKEIKGIEEIRKDYDNITPSNGVKDELNKLLNQLYKIPELEKDSIKSYFFILAPDYNMPKVEERKNYQPLYYSTLVGIDKNHLNLKEVVKKMSEYHNLHENENLWSAFYNAMKRHSFDYENESLYEDMKNTFFTRIKELSSKDNPNA